MNAGGKKKAASSFYIPLDRVERALKLLQAGSAVTRGTLQTIFKHQTYDEVRRLGLRAATEERLRTTMPDVSGKRFRTWRGRAFETAREEGT